MNWKDSEFYFAHLPTGPIGKLFSKAENPWDPLCRLRVAIELHFEKLESTGTLKTQPDLILDPLEQLKEGGYFIKESQVLEADFIDTELFIAVGQGTLLEAGATIKNHTIIGNNCEVRQGAYLRGYLYLGEGCVAGHATEMKHSILISHVEAGHFSYIGDSILGSYINLGAGTKISNLEFRSLEQKAQGILPEMSMHLEGKKVPIGLKKLGAIIGDGFEAGCNSVIAPMAFVGKECWLYPNQTLLKGVYPAKGKIKSIESGLSLRL
ncbi:MAG: glucose-1-phosphate thymidylyltransferase [SAR324 cluster bacterium]|nr:glucose-1-phosphate thymidylyltransferase [SAR324 cluster bacterium]